MAKAKYAIENSIAMQAGFRHLAQQVDFDDPIVKKTIKSFPCHIYMICSRPKITLKQNSVVISEESYSLTFVIHYIDHTDEETYTFENKLGIHSYELNKSGNRIKFSNSKGKIVSEGKTALIYPFCITQYKDVLDLKVLYIGQAFGKKGERLAADRLISHDTLQQIYAKAMDENPNEDIWIIMWQFKPYIISMMGAITSGSQIDFDNSMRNYNRIIGTDISLDQQITITEAALIKYFSPIYNTEYKTTFPSASHSSYDECYKLDFNNACFELDTISIATRLYSDEIEPNDYHVKSFFLHNEEERRNMFNINEY